MTDTSTTPAGEYEAQFGDYFALMKPRVMQLVVFTALVGMLAAPNSVHPVVGFASILFVAIGAGASGALNMWWDADIDAIMRRTQGRPIPSGRVQPGEALAIGVALSGMSVVMLGLAANLLAAGMLLFTILFYAVFYSMWLKRATPQNIVIGGAAGAFPPVIGWIIATGSFSVEAWLMFRRRGRNLGVGLLLAGFVVLVMALTFVKITNIDFNDLPGGDIQTQESN